MATGDSFDYVIVGAGSAGCVLANRLTEDADVKVLVLEAGPRDNNLWIHMPAALTYNLCHDKYNWYYHTEPQPHLDGRVMYWPRGRVLGGSSSLNAMVYIRGHALDYDRWAKAEGATGWSYFEVLPYFKRAETRRRRRRRLSRLERAALCVDGIAAQPAVPGLHRGGPAGRISLHAGHERPAAGGLRQDGHDHLQGPPLERGDGLSEAGDAAPEPHRADARAGGPHPLRGHGAPLASSTRMRARSSARARAER